MPRPVLLTLLLAVSFPAAAQRLELGPVSADLTHLFSIGAQMRMQDRDRSIIGKTNIEGQQDLCAADDCVSSSGDPAPNQRFVDAAGFYSVNGDDGNLNYDQYDLTSAVAKLTSEASIDFGDWATGFVRGTFFFDTVNNDFIESHPNTSYQPARTRRGNAANDTVGTRAELLDAYLNAYLPIPFTESELSLRVGRQVLNWGESTTLVANSLNSISPPSLVRLQLPGSDLKELFTPVPLVFGSVGLTDNVTLEAFYQWAWEPVEVGPPGTFLSTSDIAGGGDYAMLSFAKAPEDPEGMSTPAGLTALLSDSSRTLMRGPDRRPRDGGEYGFALKTFLPDFNNGTELAFYYMNYHSRFPIASLPAAEASSCRDDVSGVPAPPLPGLSPEMLACTGAADDPAAATAALIGFATGNPESFPGNALPVDTATIFLEYPEDIRMYGVSFNTTVGSVGLQGEVAFRDNLPLQIHQADLVFAALQPAFPEEDVELLGVATIPGNRNAVPDFVETRYRGNSVQPGDYIRGYERMKVAHYNLGGTMTFGASQNPIGATQVLMIFEFGAVQVFDMPSLDELQFNGPGADTHYSPGADGTGSGGTADARRQNPTQQTSGFPTELSWGYRLLSFITYDNVLYGANLSPLLGVFHDVDGYSPGPGESFIESRKQFLFGLRVDYLSTYGAELRYNWYTGAGEHNQLRDRDFLQLSLNYSF